MTNITELLKDLARAEIALMSEEYKDLERQHAALTQAINEAKAKPKAIKQAIRDAVNDHIAATGRVEAPESAKRFVTIKRVKRVVYDEDAALNYALELGRDDLLSTSLHKQNFNAALKSDLQAWAGAEEVTSLEIAISKTGELLIGDGE